MRGFKDLHPVVIFVFYITIILPAMFYMDLGIITLFFAAGLLWKWYSLKEPPLSDLVFSCICVLVMAMVNGLISGEGETELFFLADRVITLEGLSCGFTTGLMLASVFVWFMSFNLYMPAQNIIICFGGLKRTGLMVSVILRLIPEFVKRFRLVHGLALVNEPENNRKSIFLQSFSSTLTWALENSVENTLVLQKRGFEDKKYRPVKRHFTVFDTVFLLLILLLQVLYFIPKPFKYGPVSLLSFLPFFMEGAEFLRWTLFRLKK